MAKGKVTKKSLKVGQTVYMIIEHYLGDEEHLTLLKNHIECRDDINNILIYMDYLGDPFYSKKKAKTKMNKLNEHR